MTRAWAERGRRLALGGAAILALSGCEEESLRRVRPAIFVCASVDAPSEECNRPLTLGERPITLPFALSLFVHDRGEGTLDVTSIVVREGLVSVEKDAFTVLPGAYEELELTLTPEAVGPGSAILEIASDDPERSPLRIELQYTGTPRPIPRIELCLEDAPESTCGASVDVAFGVVRRSQEESRNLSVRNVGTAVLSILGVRIEGMSSIDQEFTVVTSTRPGDLAPATSAPVIVVYGPRDGSEDAMDVVFASDDPMTPEARVHLTGASMDNSPPMADAREIASGRTSLDVAVDDVVVLDGSRSADPENDPLTFSWVLAAPARSAAILDDPAAGRVSFAPDVAGSYRVELQVFDTLGQPSAVVAVVLIQARPRYGFRANLDWSSGGDVDLHLVESGGALFGAGDCSFERPNPDFAVQGEPSDDPQLVDDAIRAPGRESIVIASPGDGVYSLYAHYFDDGGAGPAAASVQIIFNDASIPVFQDTRTLVRSCALWHVGDVVFPDAVFMPSALAPSDRCR